MNKLKLAVSLMMISTVASAGASTFMFDNPDNKNVLGVRASLDISSAGSGGAMYNNNPGFAVGAVYQIPLWMNLYFEPGLSLFYDTFGVSQWESLSVPQIGTSGNPVVDSEGNVVCDELSYQINGSIRNFGFRIPLVVGYHFDFAENIKVGVFTGPQMNVNLVARYHQNAVKVAGAEQPEYSENIFGTGGFKSFDLQWMFGASLTYGNYYLGLKGGVGMTNLKSRTDELSRSFRRNNFSISLGYNF